MSKTLCDDYYMYKRVHEKGAKIIFVVGRSSGARAKGMKLAPYENIDGFPIYRPYRDSTEMLIFPQRKLKEVVTIAKELKPDLILCHIEDNMRLTLMLREKLNLKIPIVLHVEIASATSKIKNFIVGRCGRFDGLLACPVEDLSFGLGYAKEPMH